MKNRNISNGIVVCLFITPSGVRNFSHLVVILYTMTDFSMNCQGKILQFNEIGTFFLWQYTLPDLST